MAMESWHVIGLFIYGTLKRQDAIWSNMKSRITDQQKWGKQNKIGFPSSQDSTVFQEFLTSLFNHIIGYG